MQVINAGNPCDLEDNSKELLKFRREREWEWFNRSKELVTALSRARAIVDSMLNRVYVEVLGIRGGRNILTPRSFNSSISASIIGDSEYEETLLSPRARREFSFRARASDPHPARCACAIT